MLSAWYLFSLHVTNSSQVVYFLSPWRLWRLGINPALQFVQLELYLYCMFSLGLGMLQIDCMEVGCKISKYKQKLKKDIALLQAIQSKELIHDSVIIESILRLTLCWFQPTFDTVRVLLCSVIGFNEVGLEEAQCVTTVTHSQTLWSPA